MYCKKCHHEVSAEKNFCPNCGSNLMNNVTSDLNSGEIAVQTVVSVIISIISFILTIILRKSNVRKTDLTPEGLTSHYGMVVPDNAKPYILAVPIIISLILLVTAVMSDKMCKKEKAVVFIVALFSLFCSVAVVNLRPYINA